MQMQQHIFIIKNTKRVNYFFVGAGGVITENATGDIEWERRAFWASLLGWWIGTHGSLQCGYGAESAVPACAVRNGGRLMHLCMRM